VEKLDPAEAWKPWEPGGDKRLGLKWAGHLLRRATFGPSRDELYRIAAESPAAALDRLFAPDPRFAARDTDLSAAGSEIARGNKPFDLRRWWIDRMLNSGFPLREKMTLFWHNHFATSINKVQSAQLMLQQNELMRKYSLGKFGPMLQLMSKE